jgi:hypothetical protein
MGVLFVQPVAHRGETAVGDDAEAHLPGAKVARPFALYEIKDEDDADHCDGGQD